jgi:hypothetical protein
MIKMIPKKRQNRGHPGRLFTLLLLSLLLAACGAAPGSTNSAPSPSAAPAISAVPQTSEGGQVTITATWAGPNAGLVFEIVMDTHVVDLDRYDLRQLAALRVDDGPAIQPSGWEAPKGGHHRKGTLTFPGTSVDGRAVLGPETGTVELIIRDVAGVPERSFRWPSDRTQGD